MTDMTTSPTNPAAIEAVFGDGEPRHLAPEQPLTMRGEWRKFGSFLKRPVLPETTVTGAAALRGMGRMIALDLIIVSCLIALLLTVVAMGFEMPDNINAQLEFNIGTIALIVIAAPVMEELVFRSWLSGKPGYLAALFVLVVTGVIAAMLGVENTGQQATLAVAATMGIGLLLAIAALVVLRKRPPMRWFKAIFPAMFWLSAGGFALIHILNYTEGAFWALLPLVLPQFILGAIAAYNRVHYGLWTAMITHVAHNGFAVALALVGMGLGLES